MGSGGRLWFMTLSFWTPVTRHGVKLRPRCVPPLISLLVSFSITSGCSRRISCCPDILFLVGNVWRQVVVYTLRKDGQSLGDYRRFIRLNDGTITEIFDEASPLALSCLFQLSIHLGDWELCRAPWGLASTPSSLDLCSTPCLMMRRRVRVLGLKGTRMNLVWDLSPPDVQRPHHLWGMALSHFTGLPVLNAEIREDGRFRFEGDDHPWNSEDEAGFVEEVGHRGNP